GTVTMVSPVMCRSLELYSAQLCANSHSSFTRSPARTLQPQAKPPPPPKLAYDGLAGGLPKQPDLLSLSSQNLCILRSNSFSPVTHTVRFFGVLSQAVSSSGGTHSANSVTAFVTACITLVLF